MFRESRAPYPPKPSPQFCASSPCSPLSSQWLAHSSHKNAGVSPDLISNRGILADDAGVGLCSKHAAPHFSFRPSANFLQRLTSDCDEFTTGVESKTLFPNFTNFSPPPPSPTPPIFFAPFLPFTPNLTLIPTSNPSKLTSTSATFLVPIAKAQNGLPRKTTKSYQHPPRLTAKTGKNSGGERDEESVLEQVSPNLPNDREPRHICNRGECAGGAWKGILEGDSGEEV